MTLSAPPVCAPYFSDNVAHVGKLRADGVNTPALGSNELIGPTLTLLGS